MTQPNNSNEIADAEFSVAWRLRDIQTVERELEFAFGRAPDRGAGSRHFSALSSASLAGTRLSGLSLRDHHPSIPGSLSE
jgi:hypothetical protein